MPLITAARHLNLGDAKRILNLHESKELDFFDEYLDIESSLSDVDRNFLDELQCDLKEIQDYVTHEELVKMFALSPLLRLAGLAKHPFIPKAEHIIEIDLSDDESDDDDAEPIIIRGKIDILVAHKNLYEIVIETKNFHSNILIALPQALTYMMASRKDEQPIYGLCTNGTEFLFVKLVKGEINQYALSDPFSVYRKSHNELYDVVNILRKLRSIVMNT
jgi:hypothetical protein